MWIDSHAHLYDLSDAELAATVAAAVEARVDAVLDTATDLRTSAVVLAQCAAHASLYAAVGVSPFDVDGLPDNWLERLRQLASAPRVLALGEMGMDATNRRYPPIERQQAALECQLALAKELDLPAVVHSRGAERRVLDACRSCGIARAVFHCYTGDIATAKAIVDNGYYLSLSGILTFKGSGLVEVVRSVPADRLLIETDTPYLAPVPHRGKTNQSAWVGLVGQCLAEAIGMPVEKCAELLTGNFRRAFSAERIGPA